MQGMSLLASNYALETSLPAASSYCIVVLIAVCVKWDCFEKKGRNKLALRYTYLLIKR